MVGFVVNHFNEEEILMSRSRILTLALACAWLALAASAGHAAEVTSYRLKPHHAMKGQLQDPNPNASRLTAARQEALAESQGSITESAIAETSSGWTPRHWLYVGCTTKPVNVTYPTIQAAIAAAQLYTVIKVCPGQYLAGGPDTGIIVNTSYIAIEGVSAHSGAQTLLCDTSPNPEDLSWGIWLLGSHDTVQNMTVEDCAFGVESGDVSEVRNNAIANNWFNGDYESIATYLGYQNKIEDNYISNSDYPILSYAGIKDAIVGNTVEGDGTFTQDGIAIGLSVSAKIQNNNVTGAAYGLDFGATTLGVADGFNADDDVIGNHFDGNGVGVNITNNNSGNKFSCNYANGNAFGFDSDDTSGADAVPNAGANSFEKNHATGNTMYDYVDATYGYTGPDNYTNAGTADHYKGNKGHTALPDSIFFQ